MVFDGLQRMSAWPDDAKEIVQNNPNNDFIFSQSVSVNRICLNRLLDAKVFVSYNKEKHFFIAWNIAPHIRKQTEGVIIFDIRNHIKRCIWGGAIYLDAGVYNDEPHVYEKVCLIPEAKFADFYFHYEEQLMPSPKDLDVKLPAFIFTDSKNLSMIKSF